MILALKTSDSSTQFWLYSPGNLKTPLRELSWESGRDLADFLLSRLRDFLKNQDLEYESLTGIIIYSGPGSFTSLRIGHAVGNALADSLGIPIVGSKTEQWLELGLSNIGSAITGKPALPHYGAEANVTHPKT